MTLTDDLTAEYEQLFETMIVKQPDAADRVANLIARGKERYLSVGEPLGIPWYFIGILHAMEQDGDLGKFRCHIHNGDPLTDRTVQVPIGRPKNGVPPFTWEDSTKDALTMPGHDLELWDDWTIGGQLFQFEKWNGFGYRRRGHVSPYLWSGSNHYFKGKFVKDGQYDPNVISKQIGTAVLLSRFVGRGEVDARLYGGKAHSNPCTGLIR